MQYILWIEDQDIMIKYKILRKLEAWNLKRNLKVLENIGVSLYLYPLSTFLQIEF